MAASKNASHKFIERFNAAIEKKDFYEAEQISRTLFSRFVSQSKHNVAAEFLWKTATLLASNKQYSCAADLILLLLDDLELKKIEADEQTIAYLVNIIELLPTQECVMLDSCVKRTLKYVGSLNQKDKLVFIHRVLANKFMSEQLWLRAVHHATRGLLGAVSGEAAAAAAQTDDVDVVAYDRNVASSSSSSNRTAEKHDTEKYVVMPVLELLCMKSSMQARAALETFLQHLPDQKLQQSPLMNALNELIVSCEQLDLEKFEISERLLSDNLEKEFFGPPKTIYLYTNRIAQLYFDIDPKQRAQRQQPAGSGGPQLNLMDMLKTLGNSGGGPPGDAGFFMDTFDDFGGSPPGSLPPAPENMSFTASSGSTSRRGGGSGNFPLQGSTQNAPDSAVNTKPRDLDLD